MTLLEVVSQGNTSLDISADYRAAFDAFQQCESFVDSQNLYLSTSFDQGEWRPESDEES